MKHRVLTVKCALYQLYGNTISEQKASKAYLRPLNTRKTLAAAASGMGGEGEQHVLQAGATVSKQDTAVSYSKCNYAPHHLHEALPGQGVSGTAVQGCSCLAATHSLEETALAIELTQSPWYRVDPKVKHFPYRLEHSDQLQWPRSCPNVISWCTILGM